MSSPYAFPGGGPPKKSIEPWQIFVVALVIAVLFGGVLGKVAGPFLRSLAGAGGRLAAGEPAADFRATTLSGSEVQLAQLRGKVVVLDFWATWCGPCMHELPHVIAAQATFAGRDDVAMLGISLDENRAALAGTVAQKGISWPQVFDQENAVSVAELYGVQAIPYALVIGRDGKVFAKDVPGDELAEVVAAALASG